MVSSRMVSYPPIGGPARCMCMSADAHTAPSRSNDLRRSTGAVNDCSVDYFYLAVGLCVKGSRPQPFSSQRFNLGGKELGSRFLSVIGQPVYRHPI